MLRKHFFTNCEKTTLSKYDDGIHIDPYDDIQFDFLDDIDTYTFSHRTVFLDSLKCDGYKIEIGTSPRMRRYEIKKDDFMLRCESYPYTTKIELILYNENREFTVYERKISSIPMESKHSVVHGSYDDYVCVCCSNLCNAINDAVIKIIDEEKQIDKLKKEIDDAVSEIKKNDYNVLNERYSDFDISK